MVEAVAVPEQLLRGEALLEERLHHELRRAKQAIRQLELLLLARKRLRVERVLPARRQRHTESLGLDPHELVCDAGMGARPLEHRRNPEALRDAQRLERA